MMKKEMRLLVLSCLSAWCRDGKRTAHHFFSQYSCEIFVVSAVFA